MKLLFSLDDNNSDLNDLLGFVGADIYPARLKSELYSATRELIDLIGKETYDFALELHAKEEPSDEEKYLLYHFRYPVALNAYRQYVPSGDLSHTTHGRKMRNDEHEKAAFEWMINRDNEVMERKYYAALDNLLKQLDEENPIVRVAAGEITELKWKGTDSYKELKRLFVSSTADFEAYFSIGSRYLLDKLKPALKKFERSDILPRLGSTKYAELKEAVASGQPHDEVLVELIKEASVYDAMAWAMRRLRVTLLPDGVLQKYNADRIQTKATKPSEKLETELAYESFKSDSDKALRLIESHVAPVLPESEKPTSVFPDLNMDCDDNFVSS